MPSWAIEGVVNYLTLHDYQNGNLYWYSKTIGQVTNIFCISIRSDHLADIKFFNDELE